MKYDKRLEQALKEIERLKAELAGVHARLNLLELRLPIPLYQPPAYFPAPNTGEPFFTPPYEVTCGAVGQQ